ncbi:MAG TPA: condensation domain-containing protein, partial [Thermoanaerobaculia bacterium]|nr:condensation domain-containing protein [Thermoanaerobaculia bacterium]
RHAHCVKARGVLDEVELFDAAFFGYSPLEARVMDPQMRLFLEGSWEALENAGCDPERFPGAVGVYGGASFSSYLLNNLAGNLELLRPLGGRQVALHTDRDFLTTQVSYKLNLGGPSLDVQTACSTSLVAVHLARQALLAGDCDIALAGGVSVKVPQVASYLYEEGGIDSADGHCRAFDAEATGTVWGSGFGVVVLKRLEDALADGDNIRAVLLGTAINNDGSLKVGFTAPSLERQAAVVAAAQAAAGIEPASITYVEAHGTGTQLGDPIEVAALAQAFGPVPAGSCALGTVKSNIGHLGAAAGIAGLIKTVLALEHREIPRSLHFERPNPAIDFAASPFYVNARHAAWPAGDGPRRAGVSSFGLGGTNAHAVLEEAPEAAPSGPGRPWQLLPLSARTAESLDTAAAELARWLERHPEADLADVAYTLQVGRRGLPQRRVLVCQNREEARQHLLGGDPRRLLHGRQEPVRRPVVFLFPGQGAQHVGMGRGLYDRESVFRRELDACAEFLAPLLGCDLRRLLHPRTESAAERNAAAQALRQTRLAQPALFAVELALARLWRSWGIVPAAMLGHSLGEYVAACLAGVLSSEDALALVAARGELMQQLPSGAMLSVELSEAELLPWIEQPGCGLALAVVNGPSLCVVAGPAGEVADLAGRLASRGVACRDLHTSHAFHSAMMDPILAPFAERVARIPLRPPVLPYVSSLTGDWITAAEVTDPRYWTEHLRRTVRFGDAAVRLLAGASPGAGAVLLEVGPGRALGGLARRAASAETPAVASMRHPKEEGEDDLAVLLGAAGRLWLAGVDVDWQGLHDGEARRRLPLPTYPFQRGRHWIEPGRPVMSPMSLMSPMSPMLPAASERGEAPLHNPTWRPVLLPAELAPQLAPPIRGEARWLLLVDAGGLGRRLAERLAAAGRQAICVTAGAAFLGDPEDGFEIDPTSPEHYARLAATLRSDGPTMARIVHLWSLDGNPLSFLTLAGALAVAGLAGGVELSAVSAGLHEVTGEGMTPEAGSLLAACRLIPGMHPSFACRSVDVALPRSGPESERLADRLAIELLCGTEPVVAYGPQGRRWVRAPAAAVGVEGSPLEAPPESGLAERVAALFEGLLGVAGVGPHDDFFALGGHSLLGTRLLSRLRDDWGVELGLEALFAASTPAGLAREIEAARRAPLAAPAIAPSIVAAPRTGSDLPLSFAQERLWFLDRLQPGSAAYNLPTALRLRGRLDVPALARTLTEIVGRHEVLRTTFVEIDGRASQRIAPGGSQAPAIVDLALLPGLPGEPEREAEALRLVGALARIPFNLEVGPLLRTWLLRLAEEDHLLVVSMHHIVTDGWSLGVLVGEVTTLYAAFAVGRPSPLAALPLQYADYAQWQRRWLTGDRLANHLAYWRQRLAGAPALELPPDRPRPAAPSGRGGRCRSHIGVPTTEAIGALAREHRASLFIVLLAAWDALLYRYTGQADLLVGTSIANRNRSEVEELIGFFVNALVLRTGVPRGASFLALVERVREAAVGAYAHQDLPFERLVLELEPERGHGGNPLFQVAFVLQNTALPAWSLPGLQVEGL